MTRVNRIYTNLIFIKYKNSLLAGINYLSKCFFYVAEQIHFIHPIRVIRVPKIVSCSQYLQKEFNFTG